MQRPCMHACANQMQTNLTRYWWQPQSADSNFHISSMARSPNSTFMPSHPDLTVAAVSSPRISLGTRPFILGAINFICQQYHVMFCTCANKLRKMASNSKAMLRHAGEPFFAWGDPLKLRRFYGTVDLRAKKYFPFVLKAELELRAVMRQAFSRKKKKEERRWTIWYFGWLPVWYLRNGS